MRAIVIRAFGSVDNLVMQDCPETEPQDGEVRIRIRAAAFNPVDYKYRQGRFGGALPMILGCDAAGIVDAAGNNVSGLSVGDEVYAYLGGPCSNGSYAESVCVPGAFVARKPANLDFAQAAALPLVGLTAYQAVMDKDVLSAGKSVFVAGGSGGVGSIAIQLLRHLGAERILTTAGNDRSFEYLVDKLAVKPEHILRYRGLSSKQMRDRVLEMNGGPVGAAFDFWGGDMKRLCSGVLDFDGRMVSIVEEPAGFDLNVWNAARSPLFARSASLHFEFVGARAIFGRPETWSIYRSQLNELTRLVEAGHILPSGSIDVGEFSEATARQAHTLLESGHARGKLVMAVP